MMGDHKLTAAACRAVTGNKSTLVPIGVVIAVAIAAAGAGSRFSSDAVRLGIAFETATATKTALDVHARTAAEDAATHGGLAMHTGGAIMLEEVKRQIAEQASAIKTVDGKVDDLQRLANAANLTLARIEARLPK